MKYTCDVCKQECESDESDWTEEDAIKERDELWGNDEPFAILCDPCFKEHVTPERMEIYGRGPEDLTSTDTSSELTSTDIR